MKTYIVYVEGVEIMMIKAKGHNAAEAKAAKLYPQVPAHLISVEYTEI